VKESIKIIPLPDLELSEYITLSTRFRGKNSGASGSATRYGQVYEHA
jgi:hypothetical protein